MIAKKYLVRLKHVPLHRFVTQLLVVISLVIVGSIVLLRSMAATPTTTSEAEAGTAHMPATIVGDTSASNDKAVRFGNAATATVLFEDDFNGSNGQGMDTSKWREQSTCSYNDTASVGKTKCGTPEYKDGAGHLVIPATPTSGYAISTGGKFSFVYGTMSAWLKLPSQVGYWPAFWALNNYPDSHKATTDALLIGEIDAMEAYTTWPGIDHVNFHNWMQTRGNYNDPTNSHGPDYKCTSNADLSDQFHKYSAKIEPNKLTFYFDDKQCGTVYGALTNPGKPYAFGPSITRGNWLILSLQIGGAGGRQQPATQDARLLVDRVEVRSL